MIRTKGLVRTYGKGEGKVTALGGVDITVQDGEMVAVIGKSGSGKSTLLNLLGGLDSPTEGQVFYNDKEIDEYNAVDKLNVHPEVALKNAKENFEINNIQEDIIVNHMFPSTKKLPKTKYGWLVSFVDKGVAIYEMAHYKAIMQLGILLIFVFNLVSIHN